MEAVNTEKELDPREKFKAIQEQAKVDNAKAKGEMTEEEQLDEDVASTAEELGMDDDSETEDELPESDPAKEQDAEESAEAETQPVDKHVGTKKIEVTREQHQANQAQDNAVKALQALKNANQEHLNPEDLKAMKLALAMLQSGKLKDPVLVHLLNEKVELSKQYIQATVAIKELQRRMMTEISHATNAVVKCKGAIENQDRQILKLVKANPALLD